MNFLMVEKMKEKDLLKLWKGNFGDEYTNRNSINKEKVDNAEKVFRRILKDLKIESILEVGSNIGINLLGIRKALGDIVKLYAVEPNVAAFEKLVKNSDIKLEKGYNCDGFKMPLSDNFIDLVFTNGVLIHIDPKDLKLIMSEIVRISKKYVLCSEYFSHEETTIRYHNHKNALFKRDFGKYYMDCFQILKINSYGFLWQEEFSNFDNLNWWLLEKKN